jgi:hypothetical protein
VVQGANTNVALSGDDKPQNIPLLIRTKPELPETLPIRSESFSPPPSHFPSPPPAAPLSHSSENSATQSYRYIGCTKQDDLEEHQYGNIVGEEWYWPLEGSAGSNITTSEVSPERTIVSKRNTA